MTGQLHSIGCFSRVTILYACVNEHSGSLAWPLLIFLNCFSFYPCLECHEWVTVTYKVFSSVCSFKLLLHLI
jgi:hypothetical protein